MDELDKIMTNEEVEAASTHPMLQETPANYISIGYSPESQQGVDPNDKSGFFHNLVQFADVAATSFKDSVGTSIKGVDAALNKSQTFDPTYNPFKDPVLSLQGDEFMNQYRDYFIDSPNAQTTQASLDYVKQQQVNAQVSQLHPVANLIGTLAGGLIDPITVLPFIGLGAKAYNTAKSISLAGYAAEGALYGAIFNEADKQYNYSNDSPDWQPALMGAVLGSAVGGLGLSKQDAPWFLKSVLIPEDIAKDPTPNFVTDDRIWEGYNTTPNTQIEAAFNSLPKPEEPKTIDIQSESMAAPTGQSNVDHAILAEEIVKARDEWIKHELNYRRAKEATGATSGDLNPHGKKSGQALNKVKNLMKQYSDLTGVNFDGTTLGNSE